MASIPDSYRTPHGLSDDLRRIVRQSDSVTLGTINPDGSPQMTVVQFALDDANRLHVPTNGSTRKARNIVDRPVVTALVDFGAGWVSCTGRARLIEGARAVELNRRVYEHLLTDAGLASIGRFLEAHEDSTIEITPTKWLSWEANQMLGWFREHGVDPGDPADWMRDLTVR